ncbi:3-isopropylmalate dehydratase large subunit [Pollutimonas sp. M17]|uniref:3-isopropylmalate dehydratase large subunit n=1 Tax=Pollutimonas sp. M17 TaxID=2962065 RepID=UPI0021F4BC3D|nr:3-isopropylmalate dehydratase large subunit [Pollutimonas sp. M17]UYO93780.1 3-isopropylmalate dehydratase large subunit [Pollutimonas sp. M17]
MGSARSLFDKIWDSHDVAMLPDGRHLIHIDRHLVHDLSSPQAFSGLREQGRGLISPHRTVAVADHMVPTLAGRTLACAVPGGAEMIGALEDNAREFGIDHYGMAHDRQGIVHVVAPELGMVVPGMTVVCGDSHTCTLGALGAWAWGIGTSEVEHVLATQTLVMRRPDAARLTLSGVMQPGLSAKDLALYVLREIGVHGKGMGFLELAGELVGGLSMEGRLTLCNLGIEAGARAAVIAPDDVTLEYLAAVRPDLSGSVQAQAAMRGLRSDEGARYEQELALDVALDSPQMTWGINPSQVVGLHEPLPSLETAQEGHMRDRLRAAYRYMGLEPGRPLAGTPVQRVFIGSCTNGRLSDLEDAARLIAGRKVAPSVQALVVPGSKAVKRAAERQGLDKVFRDAGFRWGEPGCSMCVGMNGDYVRPGERSVSTTNRNFEGRQGPGARTHLASPASAAAAAIAGVITDHRELA